MKTTSGGKTSVANLGGNPMMSQVKTLLQACMTGDLSSLSQTCSLEYKESPEEYLVLVHPESETFKAYVSSMEIYFDRKDFSVSRLVMHEKGSDYTQYDFTSKKFNTKIDEKIFSLH
jgi:outer membrane lipoprotein-sorting protein